MQEESRVTDFAPTPDAGLVAGFIIISIMKKIRWGVLSTAAIGIEKVIPAMQAGTMTTVDAIASRDLHRARQAAEALGIDRAYGSYEELLADPEIDAVYNPLPNQLHVPWTIRAAEAGKHVLCEKPLGMDASDAARLLEVERSTGVKIGEAFMVHTAPQWLRVEQLLREGAIGRLLSIAGVFSYHNTDPANIRNQLESGGGALLDIGCYLIHAARHAFGQEPQRVVASIDRHPASGVDRLTSMMLEFAAGQAIFTCSTQMIPYQRIQFFGETGRIEIEIPFNMPPDRATRIFIDRDGDLFGSKIAAEIFPTCDQYRLQGDAFSRAILEDSPVPVPVLDGVRNMATIDAAFASARNGRWEAPQRF